MASAVGCLADRQSCLEEVVVSLTWVVGGYRWGDPGVPGSGYDALHRHVMAVTEEV